MTINGQPLQIKQMELTRAQRMPVKMKVVLTMIRSKKKLTKTMRMRTMAKSSNMRAVAKSSRV